jgi:hypothetical protein
MNINKSIELLVLYLFTFSFLIPPIFSPTGDTVSRAVWITLTLLVAIFFKSGIGRNKLGSVSPRFKEVNYYPMARTAHSYQSLLKLNILFFFLIGFSIFMALMTLFSYDNTSSPNLHALVIFTAQLGARIFPIVARIPDAVNISDSAYSAQKAQGIFALSFFYFSLAAVFYLASKLFYKVDRQSLATDAHDYGKGRSFFSLIFILLLGIFGFCMVWGGDILIYAPVRKFNWLCFTKNCFLKSDLATIWAAIWSGLFIFMYTAFALIGLTGIREKIRRM